MISDAGVAELVFRKKLTKLLIKLAENNISDNKI
jgi:hypothetical protein